MIPLDSARNQILKYLEAVKDEIAEQIQNVNPVTGFKMDASGKTIQSMQVIPSNTGGKLVAGGWIIYLENGRGPTSPTGPYQHSDDSLLDIITQWIKDKGLDLNPYAVTKKIHKEGTRLYRLGGKSGVLSIPLNGAGLSDLYAEIATMYRQSVASEIFSPIYELQTA